MKKIVSIAAIFAIAITFNIKATAQAQLPTVDVCLPKPVDFWQKASVKELAGMLNGPENMQAYAELEKRSLIALYSYGQSYEWDVDVMKVIDASAYNAQFKSKTKETLYRNSNFQEDAVIKIMFPLMEKDTAFGKEMVNCFIAYIEKNIWNERYILSHILNNKKYAEYHQKIIDEIGA